MESTIVDIPRVYTAIAEWLACMTFVLILKPRFGKGKTLLVSAAFLAAMTLFLSATASVHIWLWLPCMAVAFCMMNLLIFSCAKVRYWDGWYYTILAFVVAECVASVQWQAVNMLLETVLCQPFWLQLLAILAVYCPICLCIWKLFTLRLPKNKQMEISKKDSITAIVIGLVVFGVSNLGFVTADTPFNGQFSQEIANIRTMVDIAGVAVLYAHFVLCCENMVRMELAAVQNVLQNQYQQYKMSRESVELINYKYHDLKHQIRVLRMETDPEKRDAALERMEEEIKFYELQNKTGNSVLDTVLTGKSLSCSKNDITLTVVADGKLLNFMDIMDICSIFGNALDNAIESVVKLQDREKRLIHVTVARMKEFVMIRVENYYESPLQMAEGDFLTTKKEKDFHGYGIKSIKYTADRYGGAVDIKAEDHWFDLKILIPSPSDN